MRHGTITGYSHYGCRCEPCSTASYRYNKRRRIENLPRRVDGTGTRRRIQALMRLGWTREELAKRMGITPGGLSRLLSPNWPNVNRPNAEKVAAIYDELCMTIGPSRVTEGRAKVRGYAPPLAWDEGTIDDPDARPDTGQHEAGFGSEFDQSVARLTRHGHSAAEIAMQLGSTARTVNRARARIREQENAA